jgi:cobalt-zinc-cadmium resistance protein CzcA
MFKPMAATVLFALAASLIIALTLMPVLSWYAFRRSGKEHDTWFMRQIRRAYVPLLRRTLRFPRLTAAVALLAFAASLAAAPFMGTEFIPQLDEGSIVVMMYRLPGISITESLHGNEIIESVLREFPEVASVYCRTGRPEVATDPMGIEQSDVYIVLKPLSEWPLRRSKSDLIAAMKIRLESHAPGAVYSFSQPIQMRMQELMEAGCGPISRRNSTETISKSCANRPSGSRRWCKGFPAPRTCVRRPSPASRTREFISGVTRSPGTD